MHARATAVSPITFLGMFQPLQVGQILGATYGALVPNQVLDRQDRDRLVLEFNHDAAAHASANSTPSIPVRTSAPPAESDASRVALGVRGFHVAPCGPRDGLPLIDRH